MVLTAQQFSEALQFLRSREALVRGAEKRRATRMDVKAKLIIAPVTSSGCGERIGMLTRDISLDGLGLLTAIPILKGHRFIALLPLSESTTLFVLSEVMYCVVAADGLFTLGCQFVKVLPQQSAEKLLTAKSADVDRIRKSVLK